VVRHLVRKHSQGRDQAEAHIGDERRGDQDAVAETMDAVAGEHGPAARAKRRLMVRRVRVMLVLVLMVMLVAVMPQLGLVEQKKEDQPDQQGGKEFLGPGLAFESFR